MGSCNSRSFSSLNLIRIKIIKREKLFSKFKSLWRAYLMLKWCMVPPPKKIHICSVFGATSWFYLQFHCKICVWTWQEQNSIFFLVISITLSFQIKRNSNLNCPRGFLWPFAVPKCQQNFEILQLIWTVTPNKLQAKCLTCLIFAQTTVFHQFCYENNHLGFHLIGIKA